MNKTILTFMSAAALGLMTTACAEKADETVTTETTTELNEDGTVAKEATVETINEE